MWPSFPGGLCTLSRDVRWWGAKRWEAEHAEQGVRNSVNLRAFTVTAVYEHGLARRSLHASWTCSATRITANGVGVIIGVYLAYTAA